MFEKIRTKTEKEVGLERIAKLGIQTMEKEAETIENPRRAGGFMLATLLATGLALGIMPSTAEAQQRWSPQRSAGSRMAGQIFNGGVFGVGSAIDKHENAERDKIEHTYSTQNSQLEATEKNLDYEYSQERNRLQQNNDEQGLRKLESDYRMAKTKIAQDRVSFKKEHDKQIRKAEVRGAVIGGMLRGARGW